MDLSKDPNFHRRNTIFHDRTDLCAAAGIVAASDAKVTQCESTTLACEVYQRHNAIGSTINPHFTCKGYC